MAGLADMAELNDFSTTERENKAYISELRQLRQPPATSDEATTPPTPPPTPPPGGGHGRRLSPEEAERVKTLVAQGMAPAFARAEVLGLDEPEEAR